MPSLVSQADFDAYIRTDASIGTVDAAHRASALAAAEMAVKLHCNRQFDVVAADATPTERTFAPSGSSVLEIDDAIAVTLVEVDGVTLSASQYQLDPSPISRTGEARPYEEIRLLYGEWVIYAPGQRTVTVTGRYGWAAVPASVVEAVKILGKDLLQQRSTAGNLVSVGDFGGRVAMNTYVLRLLTPYRRTAGIA